MTRYKMATTVGANSYFVLDDIEVFQDLDNLIDADVETVIGGV